MHVQPGRAEGPVAIVAICRLEIASVLWVSDIPQTASQVRDDWYGRVQLADLIDEASIA